MTQRNHTSPAIGRAPIPGNTLVLNDADTEPIATADANHAPWCERRNLGDVCDRIGHVSPVTVVPATGQWSGALTDDGALFSFVEVFAQTDKTGTPTVAVTLTVPGDDTRTVVVTLAPAAAHTLAADLAALVAGRAETTRAPGVDGAVWAAVVAGQAGLLLVDRERACQTSAVLRRDELAKVAVALAAAVSMVTR
jgi:hypothetical protein